MFRRDIQNSDLIFFVDNQAVCASLVKGASSQPDIARIVAVTHLLWALLSVRVWVEVPSEANVSDGLSRAGVQDSWSVAQQWSLAATQCLPWQKVQELSLVDVPWSLLRWADSVTLGVCE